VREQAPSQVEAADPEPRTPPLACIFWISGVPFGVSLMVEYTFVL